MEPTVTISLSDFKKIFPKNILHELSEIQFICEQHHRFKSQKEQTDYIYESLQKIKNTIHTFSI